MFTCSPFFFLYLLLLSAVSPLPAASLEDMEKALSQKDYALALAQAQALGEEDPDDPKLPSLLNRAGSQAGAEKRLAPAAAFYEELLRQSPESRYAERARTELAACYSGLRRLEDCIEQAKENLRLYPKSRSVPYWEFLVAQSSFRLWRFEEAEKQLRAFLSAYPNGPLAKHARSCLEDINPDWELSADGVVAYSGKYEEDIRFQKALHELPTRQKEAFGFLEERVGIDLEEHTEILYRFADANRNPQGGLIAVTRVIGVENEPTTVVRFYSEHVVASPETFATTLVHEIKHAGFIGIMGHPYDSLPKWVREGLALYASNDHLMRVRSVLLNEVVAGRDPLKVLDGIDDPDHTLADYLEDGLAFAWLESLQEGNVKLFCRRLVAGEGYQQILSEISGMPYANAIQAIDAYCLEQVQQALGEGYEQFQPLRKANIAAFNQGAEATANWLNSGGQQASEAWLTEHPQHLLEPYARFCLARALIRAGQFEQGRETLKPVLTEDSRKSSLQDEAQLWLGISYLRQGNQGKAREAFGVLLRDYSFSSSAKKVAGQMPPAGPVTE